MRCWVLLVNRNHGKLYKRASFSEDIGVVKKNLFQVAFRFAIGDKIEPIYLDISTTTNKMRKVPLFVVNLVTHKAVEYTLLEKSDPRMKTKIDLLVEGSFFEKLGKKIKLSKFETFLLLMGGYGIFRFIEYIVRIVILRIE